MESRAKFKGSSEIRLLPKSFLCFDKLSMSGKVTRFQISRSPSLKKGKGEFAIPEMTTHETLTWILASTLFSGGDTMANTYDLDHQRGPCGDRV